MNDNTFKVIVDRFIKDASVMNMKRVIDFVKKHDLSDENIVYLAKGCALSGNVIDCGREIQTADIASTGGPTSLSTILCPLHLKDMGFTVPSLGVPGRPAGGVDVLAQIHGYKVDLNKEEAVNCLKKCGYVHFLANRQYAPRDAELFKYRQQNQAQNIASLVIASLLAKKQVVGLNIFGLDVRVAEHGNFGQDWERSKQNAKRFCRVSKLAGIDSRCFLTDASVPYQPYIGRGESLLALSEIFENRASHKLYKHVVMCREMSQLTVAKENTVNYDGNRLYYHFVQNLEAQGGTVEAFHKKVKHIRQEHDNNVIHSPFDGFLNIDIAILRSLLVTEQTKLSSNENRFPDPCGIILLKTTGEYIEKGDALFSLRSTESLMEQDKNKFLSAFTVSESSKIVKSMEVISHE